MSTNTSQENDNGLGIVFKAPTKDTVPEATAHVVTPQKQGPMADAPISHLGGQKVFDVEKAFSNEHGDEGTVVSDKRYSRPSIGESLAGAWNEWLWKAKARVEKVIESTPKLSIEEPEVAPAETRKEVIAEAAVHATIAPKDDHRVVAEKIRTMGNDTKRVTNSPITITPSKPDSSKGSWAHYEEKVAPVEEKKVPSIPDFRMTAIAPDVTKKITSPVVASMMEKKNNPSVPAPEKPVQPQKIMVPSGIQKKRSSIIESAIHIAPRVQRDTSPTYSTPLQHSIQSKGSPLVKRETPRVSPEASRTTMPEVVKTAPVVAEKPKVTIPPPQPTPPVPTPTQEVSDGRQVFHSNRSDWSLKELSSTHTHTPAPTVPRGSRTTPSSHYTPFTWAILGGIVLLGAALAIIASMYFNVFRGEKVVETPDIQTSIETDGIETVTITEDARASLTSLSDAVLRVKPERTEIRLAVTQGETTHVATTEEFLTTIGAHVSPTILRAFGDVLTVGSITTTETVPYFVFRTSRFDTLFVGFLEWERTLYSDFTPLFGTNTITNPIFKDIVVDGKPARVLINDAGLDVVAYGFLGQNTVVLTKNRDALLKLFREL